MPNRTDRIFFALIASVVIMVAYVIYSERNEYSADRYYVRVRVGDGCVVTLTRYEETLGLAPLVRDKNCSLDMEKMHKGDLPFLG